MTGAKKAKRGKVSHVTTVSLSVLSWWVRCYSLIVYRDGPLDYYCALW